MPQVSVVMPAYNAGKYIAEALDSLINQTLNDWECIVVNDGSTDDTLRIIEKYAAQDSRIRYTSISNTGSAKIPRDTAISMSASAWITSLDADDTIAPDTLEKQLERQRQTGADIILLCMVMTDENNRATGERLPDEQFDFSQILTGYEAAKLTIGGWIVGGGGALISKRIFDSRHPVKNYMNADEYDTRQMLIAAKKVAFVDTPYYYRENGSSVSRALSVKNFDSIYTNKLLSELVDRTYGADSRTAKDMLRSRINDLAIKRMTLLRYPEKFTVEQRKKLNELIKINFFEIQYKNASLNLRSLLLNTLYPLFLLSTRMFVKIKRR